MSAATFVCPHCGHTYPFKPALVDKPVRCTTCKNAFRLKADGIAEKVTAPAPTAPKPAAPAPAPAPTPLQASPIAPITPAPPVAAAPVAKKPAAPPAPSPTPALAPPTPATPSQRLSPPTPKAGMTRQQEEARRQMADSLRSAMGSLADEDLDLDEAPAGGSALSGKNGGKSSKDSDRQDPKRSSERLTKDPKRSSERLARVKSQSERFKVKDGRKGPAILTGEGEREAAIQRRWLFAFAALIVVAVVLGFLATRTSARSAALADFTRELPANENRYGARIPGIQKRAWLPDVTPFIELPDPRLGRVEEVPPAVLADALGKLKGLVWVPAAERWVAQGKVEWLTAQLAEDPQGLAKRLEKAGVVQVSRKAMSDQLAAANLNDEGVEVVLRLLTSGLFSQLAAHPPSGIHWCTVRGRKGIYISDPGQGYKYPTADYQGVLLQLSGDEWPGSWKLLTLNVAAPGK